jgi:hypothetical protein
MAVADLGTAMVQVLSGSDLAVKAGCDSVVTYDIRDFTDIERFGVSAVTTSRILGI